MQLPTSVSPALLSGKTRYAIPNLITLASMGLGLASIFFSIRGSCATAGWLIMFSVIFDKLDGSSARLFNATSMFGTELDSFSDFVAFGIAPSVLVYAVLSGHPALTPSGDEAVFFYVGMVWLVFASALRLARFNITSRQTGSFMVGLPTTAAGGIVALWVLTGLNHHETSEFFTQWLKVLPFVLIVLGLLEVSNLKLPKVAKRRSKLLNLYQVVNFILLVALILLRKLPEVLLFLALATTLVSFAYCYIRQDEIDRMIEEEIAAAETRMPALSQTASDDDDDTDDGGLSTPTRTPSH